MECIFIAGISFLLGFKVAAHLSKRHLARMKSIWGVGAAGQTVRD